MRVVCCICNKVKTDQGWRSLAVKAEERPSHGFCPDCYQRQLRIIEARGSEACLAA